MPVVPFSPTGPAPMPQPDEQFIDMAAAMMKHERKPPEPKEPAK
jgi:hypothetical protein